MARIFIYIAVAGLAQASRCYLPLDVMFLQDTTGSQESIIGTMIEQIPLVYAGISSRFPDTHFAVAEFQDKPYMPLGIEEGFCYKLATPMTEDMTTVVDAYSWLYASGGGDIPEAQYQAIIDSALDPAVGWRTVYNGTNSMVEGCIGGRIIIMMTDAVPHLNGDMAKFAAFPTVPQGLPENSGIISTDDIDFECLYQEYPSPDQLKAALKSTNTSLIILSPEDPAIVPAWTWVNTNLLGQPSTFYRRIESNMKNLFEVLVDLLEDFSTVVPCETSTPTAQPGQSSTAPGDSTTTNPSATGGLTTQTGTSSSPDCQACVCPPSGPCAMCPPECNAAVVVRFKQEPKKLQVIVDNQ